VQVYELSYPHMAKSFAFRGIKEVTPKEIQIMLDIPQPLTPTSGQIAPTPKNK
jgi:hypothetical protein